MHYASSITEQKKMYIILSNSISVNSDDSMNIVQTSKQGLKVKMLAVYKLLQ